MDNVTLEQFAQRCNHLSEKFCGVWSADNFPAMKQGDSFQIVNTELSCRPGRHWILLCTQKDFARRGKAVIVFGDSLGKKPKTYKKLYLRLLCLYDKIIAVNHPLQSRFSNCCGLYCIYLSHRITKRLQKHCQRGWLMNYRWCVSLITIIRLIIVLKLFDLTNSVFLVFHILLLNHAQLGVAVIVRISSRNCSSRVITVIRIKISIWSVFLFGFTKNKRTFRLRTTGIIIAKF